MTRWITLLFSFGAVLAQAQVANGPVQQEINAQLWKAFQYAYGVQDDQAFNALHTTDVVRVIRDSETIMAGPAYYAANAEHMAKSRERGGRRTIDFRFTQRFAAGDHAYESGYYRVITRYGESEQYTFYGRFDVVLRRENGRWKILLDSDSSEKGTLTEADFMKGQPME